MALMTMKWSPDPETAEIFATYAEAVRTERDLKPDVRERAEAALKAGATGTQLARLTGMTPEVFRRMARDLQLPIDPRYRERAEASRKRPAVTADQPAPEPAKTAAPEPRRVQKYVRMEFPSRVFALTAERANTLALLAYERATEEQRLVLVGTRKRVAEVDADAADRNRAVVEAATKFDPPLLTDEDLPEPPAE